MNRNKPSRILPFLLTALLSIALLAAFPASASEQEESLFDYNSYYAEGAKIAWDAFDKKPGDEHSLSDTLLFGSNGSFGEGYLSIKDTALSFTDIFANDGQTDYTIDLTVAMQISQSGTMDFGALRNLSVGMGTGVKYDGHPVDESYGIVSNVYRALTASAGNRVEIASDVGWQKIHFIGKPLGEVYSFGVSTDYRTDTAYLTLWRDAASVRNATLANPVTAYNAQKPLDTTVFGISKTINYDYYALRYYERALTPEEMQLNHFVDLAKWFEISLDVYDTYSEDVRQLLHIALREETFDTLTQADLQNTVDSFGTLKNSVHIDDYISFEGFSAALWGSPSLRSIYEVDRTAIASLEKQGYNVTVGALVAIENGRDIADITLDTVGKVIAREVYRNGAFVGTTIESDEESFRFALSTCFDGADSREFYEENLLYRAYMTLEKDGERQTLYLDAEGESLGQSVTIQKVSLLLSFLGDYTSSTIKEVLGSETLSLANTFREDYRAIFETRKTSEVLIKDISDYLFVSYALRQKIMSTTGVSGSVYTYANASSYYKLFTTDHKPRNVAEGDTVLLLIQCENTAANVIFASKMTTKIYTKLLEEEASFKTYETLMQDIEAAAFSLGLDAEKSAFISKNLTSYLSSHEKFFADSLRDVAVINTNIQAVKKTLDTPTASLASLRDSLFEANDLPAFGSGAPLSSYAIVTDLQNESSALMLSSMLSEKYGIFVPYYSSFPASAEHTYTISLFDSSHADAASLLNDNDYLLSVRDANPLIYGQNVSDAQLAALVFVNSLSLDELILKETVGRDIPELFTTDLPTYLKGLTVKAVEDGGVMDRFNQVLLEMPDEYTVVEPISSADYPFSTDQTVYVSPKGDDQADGSYNAPFKTLERALSYAVGKGGVQILLLNGTYKIEKSLSISALHSGTKQSPLYISAAPDSEVILTTADTVMGKNFSSVTDEEIIARLNSFRKNNHKNVYVADLPSLGITEYGKTTTSGEPLLLLDGEQYTLARYPNAKRNLVKLMTSGCILKQSQVSTGASSLYEKHNSALETEPGWKIRIDQNSDYRSRIEKWTWTDGTNTAESIWLHGALYAEWHRAHYPLVIANEVVDEETGTTDITLSSKTNCGWGVAVSSSNNGYFYNILEELDTDGEWYLDHSEGKLYIYSSTGIAPDSKVTMVSDTHNILNLSGASNVVLNGITFEGTLGRGLLISECEGVLVQNCTFRDTRSNGCRIENSYNSGIISSDFSRISTGMLSIQGKGDRNTMTPDRLFVQNCFFHDPKVQTGLSLSGVSCLASHNLFDDTTVSFSGTECILEYNEFNRGSQITYDSGPIYCSGPYGPKGNHIRYNYLHDLNFSYYGIYIDDLSSDNYVYSNIVSYASSVTKSGKGVNLHNGHQNVVYNNVLINAKDAGIRDNANYYVKYVCDANGTQIKTPYIRYYTASDGTQSFTESTVTGGGLGYRWDSMLTDALKSYDNTGGGDMRFAERFPNVALYMELLRIHLDAAHAEEDHQWDSATVSWDFTSKEETKYAWGDESLYDFLMANKTTQDIEVFLRAPAYNEYVGNVCLGCATDIYSYTHWGAGLKTTNIQNNYGYPADSEYYRQAMQGELSLISQASTWQETVPGFKSIPYEKFGMTALSDAVILCPGMPTEESYDFNQPFGGLFNKS